MRDQLRVDAARFGLKARIGRRGVQNVAREIVAISREGLRRRAREGAMAVDEAHFLDPLTAIAQSGVTMGEYLAQHFAADLHGDARKLLSEVSF